MNPESSREPLLTLSSWLLLNATGRNRPLPNATDCYQMLPDYYRLLPAVTCCYLLLPDATECYRPPPARP